MTITLESADADTCLYLRDGNARSGDYLYQNDDDGGITRSTIEETLSAGSYTIEATTYGTGETGDFTLTVSGLSSPGEFTSVSAGVGHTCGLKQDGSVVCWGWNSHGQATPASRRVGLHQRRREPQLRGEAGRLRHLLGPEQLWSGDTAGRGVRLRQHRVATYLWG